MVADIVPCAKRCQCDVITSDEGGSTSKHENDPTKSKRWRRDKHWPGATRCHADGHNLATRHGRLPRVLLSTTVLVSSLPLLKMSASQMFVYQKVLLTFNSHIV